MTNIVPLKMADWGMQLPFLLIDFAMAGLLGALFNSIRMWLWKVSLVLPWNASKLQPLPLCCLRFVPLRHCTFSALLRLLG